MRDGVRNCWGLTPAFQLEEKLVQGPGLCPSFQVPSSYRDPKKIESHSPNPTKHPDANTKGVPDRSRS